MLSLERTEQPQQQVRRVYISPAVRRYLVAVVNATRHHPQIALGASPAPRWRLCLAAQANAILSERHFVTPDDVQRMAVPVLAHRLILRSDSQGKIPRAEQVIQEILKQVPVPMGEET